MSPRDIGELVKFPMVPMLDSVKLRLLSLSKTPPFSANSADVAFGTMEPSGAGAAEVALPERDRP
jgi:hypothetical protein